ncbi:NAD(P)-dependent oxidoreductase [Oceanicola sp. 22II-s10i]|uniref:NAD-dependent epimerase/dehydratase family protein n=1 Tax=Oceanicola sp. 22II-s10i TaxID=1317116 RepID=UPI000B524C93|nr:SDR family oxidoreductase [Oceanicola sp. 22II-s10i]
MSNILVVGASGKLGRILRSLWEGTEAGARVSGWIGRDHPGYRLWTETGQAGGLGQAETVLAMWGVTAGTPEELADNALLARRATELARAVGARRVIHMSSAAVYGGGGRLWTETDTPAPRNPYGAAKALMEREIAKLGGTPASCALRLANVAGADMLFSNLALGNDIVLDRFPDGGGPLRSYVAPSDLAAALLRLSDLPPEDLPPVLNLAGPAPVAMDGILAAAGRTPSWRPAPQDALQSMAISDSFWRRIGPPLVASADPERLVAEWRTLMEPVT